MKNKINVNISPNPLDLQTLHCSQNDTSERKFYFTLHNNGEVIDTTDISDPIFEPFSVYKGGTEQLLPVNTDDPTTSPIIADIQYPDEEKTEQEFTYRESPTTLDGNAIIEKLYGNTLVWNQIINGYSYTANEGPKTFNLVSGTQIIAGHKLLMMCKTSDYVPSNRAIYLYTRANNTNYNVSMRISKTKLSHEEIVDIVQGGTGGHANANGDAWIYQPNAEVDITDFCIFDLTAMFGATKADEIYAMEQSESGSGVAYFRSLYPLPYYQYTEGKLLPFGTPQQVTWNQLVDAPQTSGDFDVQGVNLTYGTNTITLNSGTASANIKVRYNNYDLTSGHKYAVWGSPKKSNVNNYYLYIADSTGNTSRKAIFADPVIYDCQVTENARLYLHVEANVTANHNVFQPQIVDLTVMYGSGKEPSIEYFKQNYSGYYPYDSGSVVSANVSGIKSVGFNQWDEEWENGAFSTSNGNPLVNANRVRSKNFIPVFPSTEYYIEASVSYGNISMHFYDANQNWLSYANGMNRVFTTPSDCHYIKWNNITNNVTEYTGGVCINISDLSKNGTYEPYKSSTKSFPISTYFPTGMKSAGSVYDELTNTKAIKRIDQVDMGDLVWYVDQYGNLNANVDSSALGKANVLPNILCALFPTIIFQERSQYTIPCITIVDDTNRVQVRNSGYSDATAFKNAMSGIYLAYEMVDEEVTEFTHASLICEDGESTLYQDVDSLVCDCTEDFSKDSGFKDCKIKFTNDDGVVYSNKIQLHIERKP